MELGYYSRVNRRHRQIASVKLGTEQVGWLAQKQVKVRKKTGFSR